MNAKTQSINRNQRENYLGGFQRQENFNQFEIVTHPQFNKFFPILFTSS